MPLEAASLIAVQKITPALKQLITQPAPVMRAGIRALQSRRISVVPDWANEALVILTWATPRWLLRAGRICPSVAGDDSAAKPKVLRLIDAHDAICKRWMTGRRPHFPHEVFNANSAVLLRPSRKDNLMRPPLAFRDEPCMMIVI